MCSKHLVMTTIALKKYLISRINLIDDDTVLDEIKKILDTTEKVYELSPYQINLVNEAREDIKNGNFITQEEMNLKVATWAKRK